MAAPLLQPPPQDINNPVLLRQWLYNMYFYLSQQNLDSNGQATSISNLQTDISQSPQLIYSVTATNTLSITLPSILSSSYTYYQIILDSLISVTTAGRPLLQLARNGTIDSTAVNYTSNIIHALDSTAQALFDSTSSGFALTRAVNMGTSAVSGLSGTLYLTNTNPVSNYCRLVGITSNWDGTDLATGTVGGLYEITGSPITGLSILGSAGNISGTIKIYGIP